MFGKRPARSNPLLYTGGQGEYLCHGLRDGREGGEAFRRAVRALEERDDSLADRVIREDDAIDDMEAAIDQECLSSIAMRQPVREDLRFVFAVLKIITDLERIGDQGVYIANKAQASEPVPAVEAPGGHPQERDIATEMVDDSLRAFEGSDIALAEAICMRDDELDALYEAIFDELIEILGRNAEGDQATAERAAGLLWIARHLARIGDHATNVAERVYFMVVGRG